MHSAHREHTQQCTHIRFGSSLFFSVFFLLLSPFLYFGLSISPSSHLPSLLLSLLTKCVSHPSASSSSLLILSLFEPFFRLTIPVCCACGLSGGHVEWHLDGHGVLGRLGSSVSARSAVSCPPIEICLYSK